MVTALVFNPGSNSLKFELVQMDGTQRVASEARKLVSASIDNIGKQPQLTASRDGKNLADQEVEAADMTAAVHAALGWLRSQAELKGRLDDLDFVAVRVVHGGTLHGGPAKVEEQVLRDIEALEDLAPLHNRSSLEILHATTEGLPGVPAFVTFDTAFHQTLPETAWRYPIERETADRHGVRKFGFHGVSHRYMLEHFAYTAGKRPDELNLVTLHLESGCSACAIHQGRSVDTTMGLTPLEGLMMGSRSGSIDPAIVPFLMRKQGMDGEAVLELLNKKSGMLGIAGESLDTRVLEKRGDEPAKLALRMFGYRVRLAVGAYLAALGAVDAVLFGGGIGEDSPWLRAEVCEGLAGWGLQLNPEANQSTRGMVRITTDDSRLAAWALPSEEALQIAHECLSLWNRDRATKPTGATA